MNGYWRSDQTVFVSGDEVTRGWQKVLDRYKTKYSDRAKMGALTFSDLEITPLSSDSAVALGSWKLKRENDEPHGRFTLIFRRLPDGWKIIHDHTSAAESDSSKNAGSSGTLHPSVYCQSGSDFMRSLEILQFAQQLLVDVVEAAIAENDNDVFLLEHRHDSIDNRVRVFFVERRPAIF